MRFSVGSSLDGHDGFFLVAIFSVATLENDVLK